MTRSCTNIRLFLLSAGLFVLSTTVQGQDDTPGRLTPDQLPAEVLAKPIVIKAVVGQVVRLAAAGENSEEGEKLTILWQVPPGLSHKVDSNLRDIFAAAAAPGSYKVVAIVSKNAMPRPQLWMFETLVEVTASSDTPVPASVPSKPAGKDSSSKVVIVPPSPFDQFSSKLKVETSTISPAIRTVVGKAYLTVAKFLESNPGVNAEEELRKLNEQLQPLQVQSSEYQKVLGQIGALVNSERAMLGNTPSRMLYRPIAAGLGVTE